ncbi:hypothetical protein RA876_19345 (plasmid) [Rhodoferax antarcticus]|nr:hypothetical protein RA876_19345 [Rhodoferax antarcticus]
MKSRCDQVAKLNLLLKTPAQCVNGVFGHRTKCLKSERAQSRNKSITLDKDPKKRLCPLDSE